MKKIVRVMIVDDDSDDTVFLKSAFSNQSAIEVTFSEHSAGQEAINHLYQLRDTIVPPQYPHVIFLDLHMPGMTGYQLLKAIKSEAAFLHIPVMIMSSSMLRSDEEKCLAAGCDKFYTKPSSLEEYSETAAATIQHLFEKGALQDA